MMKPTPPPFPFERGTCSSLKSCGVNSLRKDGVSFILMCVSVSPRISMECEDMRSTNELFLFLIDRQFVKAKFIGPGFKDTSPESNSKVEKCEKCEEFFAELKDKEKFLFATCM